MGEKNKLTCTCAHQKSQPLFMQDCIYGVNLRLREDSQVELDLTLTCS